MRRSILFASLLALGCGSPPAGATFAVVGQGPAQVRTSVRTPDTVRLARLLVAVDGRLVYETDRPPRRGTLVRFGPGEHTVSVHAEVRRQCGLLPGGDESVTVRGTRTLVFPGTPSRLTFGLVVDWGLEPLEQRVHATLTPDFGRFAPEEPAVVTRSRCLAYEEPRALARDDDALNIGIVLGD